MWSTPCLRCWEDPDGSVHVCERVLELEETARFAGCFDEGQAGTANPTPLYAGLSAPLKPSHPVD